MFRFLNKNEPCRYSRSLFLHCNVKIQSACIQSFRYKSYYTSLGLDTKASQKDIKSAYYNLSLKFHPDKTDGSPESVQKFREIAEAYEVLGNPEKKQIYDRDLAPELNYDPDFRRNNVKSRSNYYWTSPPRSGRSQYYNYDEHFRRHYEEYYKQKEAEQEHFRRKYEADRRYRYGDEYGWSKHRDQPKLQEFRMRDLFRRKSMVYLLTFWILFMMVSFTSGDADRPRHQRVYYDVKGDDEKRS